jgi:hypothetical protein
MLAPSPLTSLKAALTPCRAAQGVVRSATKGMLGLNRIRCWLRGSAAVSLALLLSFSTLVPIAAEALEGRATHGSHCKTKGSCCCHGNRNRTSGPAVSAKSCAQDCCQATLGGVIGNGYLLLRYQPWTPAIHIAVRARAAESISLSVVDSHSLRQRPPPHSL